MHNTQRLEHGIDQGQLPIELTARALVLRVKPSALWSEFEDVTATQSFRPDYDALIAQGLDVTDDPQGPFDTAIVQITRSKEETKSLIAQALQLLAPNGLLVLDGSKTDGIDSHLKALKKITPVEGTFSKAHGKTVWVSRPDVLPAEIEDWHVFSEPGQTKDGFWTKPGLFSADGLDAGTVLLAEHLPKLKGRVADFGAGWGALSALALSNHQGIETLALYDAEQQALDCAKRNVTDSRAEFHWQDVTSLSTKDPFDFVISNPPFHTTRKADPELGIAFLRRAARCLKPSGQLWLVANRQLPYEEPLRALFRNVNTMAQTNVFKIMSARAPLKQR